MSYFAILYLALPAFVANMLPVLATKINFCPVLARPVDCGKKFLGREIFGQNKSWRGLLAGTLGGALIGALQFCFQKYQIYSTGLLEHLGQFLLFGALAGLGALVGDLAGSFLKRLWRIAPGRPFLPLDQIDYILGFLVFTNFLINWEWRASLFLLLFASIANPLVNLSAYFLGLKKTFW
ncbi:MAG: CDP-archaeol synthase [Patescibacteria group bacterium]